MSLPGRTAESINRGINRHHVLAAVIAFIVSLGLHASLLTRMDHLALLPTHPAIHPKKYMAIEMADVRLTPPPPREDVKRQPLDRPDVEIPSAGPEATPWTELKAPEPVRLPLPEPPAEPVVSAVLDMTAELPTAFRQEVLAIQDQLFTEEESTLPRRWVEAEIPKVHEAPDIQLPVELPETPSGAVEFSSTSAAAAMFVEDTEAGTPDWMAIMAGRQAGTGEEEGIAIGVSSRGGRGDDLLKEKPEDVSQLKGIEDLLQVRVAGYTPQEGDGSLYFSLQIERGADTQLPVQPRDVLFIQDSSESMTPWKLDECRRGLKRWLDFLNPGDRFEILGFRDTTIPCFGGWRDYNAESRAEAFAFIDGLRAVGNTDVYQSLQSALAVEPSPDRTLLIVLVTDGRPTVGVIGSSEIIEGVTRFNRGRVSIFSLGGGKKVNSFFLDLLSYRNRGDALVVKGDEEIPGAMETWARQLRQPVLTDLSYSFSGIDSSEIYPKQLTHLFLDRPLIIHGRLPVDVNKLVFQVVGRAGTEWHDMIFVINRDQIAAGSSRLQQQWAWQKIYHMIGDYIGGASPEKLEVIRTFADRHGLIVPYGFSRALPARDR